MCSCSSPAGTAYHSCLACEVQESLEQPEHTILFVGRALPSSLLLLSRAFTVTAPVAGRPAEADLQMESLKDTLGALNREVVEEVGFEVGDIGCAAAQRLACTGSVLSTIKQYAADARHRQLCEFRAQMFLPISCCIIGPLMVPGSWHEQLWCTQVCDF